MDEMRKGIEQRTSQGLKKWVLKTTRSYAPRDQDSEVHEDDVGNRGNHR